LRQTAAFCLTHYNSPMKLALSLFLGFSLFSHAVIAQDASKPSAPSQPQPKSVTVPITLDHNRVVIDVYLPLADGSSKRVRGWVDTGNSDLWMSRRVATLMGLTVDCGEKTCSATGSLHEIVIGGMNVSLANLKQAKIMVKSDQAQDVMIPGMSAEINIPSTILRNYAIVVNFPDREFTIGAPGSVKFNGMSGKIFVNPENGLVQVPCKIDNQSYNLGLDVGASISFLSRDVFDKLAASHSQWPRMTGAVGPANMWGADDEPQWKLLRLERLQYGPQFLSGSVMVSTPPDASAFLEKRAGIATAGLLGSNALLNYRIAVDYAHKMAYFEIGTTFKAPDFDVVGLILRPETDGRFTVIGVADFEGKPSAPEVQAGDRLIAVDNIPAPGSTMGQVWSLLEGMPGQERKLTLERGGNQFTVAAKVQHFLGGEAPEKQEKREKQN
jgi:hypothetical protein